MDGESLADDGMFCARERLEPSDSDASRLLSLFFAPDSRAGADWLFLSWSFSESSAIGSGVNLSSRVSDLEGVLLSELSSASEGCARQVGRLKSTGAIRTLRANRIRVAFHPLGFAVFSWCQIRCNCFVSVHNFGVAGGA